MIGSEATFFDNSKILYVSSETNTVTRISFILESLFTNFNENNLTLIYLQLTRLAAVAEKSIFLRFFDIFNSAGSQTTGF